MYIKKHKKYLKYDKYLIIIIYESKLKLHVLKIVKIKNYKLLSL